MKLQRNVLQVDLYIPNRTYMELRPGPSSTCTSLGKTLYEMLELLKAFAQATNRVRLALYCNFKVEKPSGMLLESRLL